MTSMKSSDDRWDMHSDRQLAASKGGALAITVLNSASWLALLSQASELTDFDIGWSILAWGFGALLGTLIWLFIYRSTILQSRHDFDRENEKFSVALDNNIKMGVGAAVAALACFGAGVLLLAIVFV